MNGKNQGAGTVAGNGSNRKVLLGTTAGFFEFLQERIDAFLALFFRDQIQFVQDQPAWLFSQRGIVLFQFGRNGDGVVNRIGFRVERCQVHQMHDQTGARQVAQEAMAQTSTFRRAFDHTRNIGDNKATVFIGTHHAQVGVQRRKRVVGDFGFGRGDGANKGALARIG